MDLKPGDRVAHPSRSDWGIGEVLPDSSGGKVRIYFVHGGEKLLKGVPLQVLTGESAAHPLLDHRKKVAPRKGLTRKTIPESIAKFRGIFPDGFRDARFLEKERNPKVKAHELMESLLGRAPFDELMASESYDEIASRALRVVAATTLIVPNEKTALRDGLGTAAEKKAFSRALHAVLYGEAELEARTKDWFEVLTGLEAAKWTVASYFQFMAFPDRYIAFKPVITQDAADVCSFELSYKPELNWITYHCTQNFAGYLRVEIASLEPRDMIDLQSFISCIAPGKHT
jgi:hypothetical protein